MREMKDSGVEWIGEIPTDWGLKRLKALFLERKEMNDPVQTDFILSLGATYGVVPYSEKEGGGNKAKEDLTDYRLAYPNDIVMNSMNIISGSVGLSKYFGCVSPVYYMLYPRQDNVDPVFFCYMFQTKAFQRSLLGLGNGILMKESSNGTFNTVRMRIPMEKLGVQLLPLPTIDEQKRIAEMLDRTCAEIDAVIEKTKATIEEYKVLKQSVITEAVTKGVRGNRPMKNSGIEWIGEIPAEWDVVRKLSYICTGSISYGIVKLLEHDDENGVKVLRCSDVLPGKISLDNVRTVTQKVSNEYARTILSGGEIVTNVRGTLGGCAIVPQELKGYNVAREVAVIPLQDNICNRYFMYFFLSDIFINYQNRYLTGSVYVGLNIELLSSCPIVFPAPKEQAEIADYLDKKCNEINTLITKKTALLEEMETYKKSVIYEYVTGKKEVQ